MRVLKKRNLSSYFNLTNNYSIIFKNEYDANLSSSLPPFSLKNLSCFLIFFSIKVFMLGITMQLEISARRTLQVTTIIRHHMKKVIIKKK